MSENTEKVPRVVIGAMADALCVLRASWTQDDEALATIIGQMEDHEVRSVLGAMPWITAFALKCPDSFPPEAFLWSILDDLQLLQDMNGEAA